MRRQAGPGSRRSAWQSARRQDPPSATGRSSASSARAAGMGRAHPARCLSPRDSSASLLRTRGARGEFPLVLEQVLEEPVVPLGRVVGPYALEAAGDCMGTLAAAVLVLPAQALLLDGGALGFRTEGAPIEEQGLGWKN